MDELKAALAQAQSFRKLHTDEVLRRLGAEDERDDLRAKLESMERERDDKLKRLHNQYAASLEDYATELEDRADVTFILETMREEARQLRDCDLGEDCGGDLLVEELRTKLEAAEERAEALNRNLTMWHRVAEEANAKLEAAERELDQLAAEARRLLDIREAKLEAAQKKLDEVRAVWTQWLASCAEPTIATRSLALVTIGEIVSEGQGDDAPRITIGVNASGQPPPIPTHSHPEYVTRAEFDSLERRLADLEEATVGFFRGVAALATND